MNLLDFILSWGAGVLVCVALIVVVVAVLFVLALLDERINNAKAYAAGQAVRRVFSAGFSVLLLALVVIGFPFLLGAELLGKDPDTRFAEACAAKGGEVVQTHDGDGGRACLPKGSALIFPLGTS